VLRTILTSLYHVRLNASPFRAHSWSIGISNHARISVSGSFWGRKGLNERLQQNWYDFNCISHEQTSCPIFDNIYFCMNKQERMRWPRQGIRRIDLARIKRLEARARINVRSQAIFAIFFNVFCPLKRSKSLFRILVGRFRFWPFAASSSSRFFLCATSCSTAPY